LWIKLYFYSIIVSTNVIKEDITKIRTTLKKNTKILSNPDFGKKVKEES